VIRPLSRTALTLDIVGAFVLFAVFTPLSLAFYAPNALSSSPAPEPVVIGVLVIAGILQCGGVAIGRLMPGVALIAAWLGAIVQMLVGVGPIPLNLAILLVLYATAAWGSTRVFWAGLVSVVVGGVVAALYIVFAADPTTTGVFTTVSAVVLLVIVSVLTLGSAWLGGFLWRMILRSRRIRAAQVRAEQATAEEQERVRIARDMHDVVAHSLAVVIAQADGAQYAAAAEPALAQDALGTIAQTARTALSDVRMLLTQLRHRQGEGPQPTLADLETLFAQVRQAGVEPRVTVDPMPPGEPPGAIQLAVYRILQEALTNAIRHGDGAVDVRLSWWRDRVDLEVRNGLSGAPLQTASGHGLIGMRERAQLVGGALDAEREAGEFVVRATLPIGPDSGSADEGAP
jgi:signal transduction histidine kinase